MDNITINGTKVALIPTGRVSGAGLKVLKGEMLLANGTKIYVNVYEASNSEPKPVNKLEEELRQAKEENARLLKAKGTDASVLDTGKRKVAPKSADGGTNGAVAAKARDLEAQFKAFMKFQAMQSES